MLTIRFKEMVLGVVLLLAACGSNPTEPGNNEQNAIQEPGSNSGGITGSDSVSDSQGIIVSDYSTLNLDLVSIPGGTSQMGSNNGESNERPVHQVTISAFQMSAKEITNSQYAAYLNAALADGEIYASIKRATGAKGDYTGQEYIYLENPGFNGCWIYFDGTKSFSVTSGKENLPVTFVSWFGAKAFAVKYGLDLPREAEWEYAARGGKGYEYGTADGIINHTNACWGQGWYSHPKNVGSYPANPFGLYDLAGNVWEWCNDWAGSYSDAPQTNPTGPSGGTYRIMRGGDFIASDEYQCRSAYRSGDYPNYNDYKWGFRVVKR